MRTARLRDLGLAEVSRSAEARRILANLTSRQFTPAWIAQRMQTTPAAVLSWRRGECVPAPAELARLRGLVRSARW